MDTTASAIRVFWTRAMIPSPSHLRSQPRHRFLQAPRLVVDRPGPMLPDVAGDPAQDVAARGQRRLDHQRDVRRDPSPTRSPADHALSSSPGGIRLAPAEPVRAAGKSPRSSYGAEPRSPDRNSTKNDRKCVWSIFPFRNIFV